MINLEGKKILLMAPSYFDYELDIVQKLESMGAFVKYFDERPFSSSLDKFILRVNPRLFEKKIDEFYRRTIASISAHDFDFVLWIKAAVVSRDTLKFIRKLMPQAKFIMYQWDSVRNNSNTLNVYDLFDKVLSFDPEDCDKYGFDFRPLFYSDRLLQQNVAEKEYDFYCIASVGLHHSDRHIFISQLHAILKHDYTYILKAYCPSKILYLIRRIRLLFFGVILDGNLTTFKSVPKEEAYRSMCLSDVVVDYTHSEQVGLPMRIIECLGAQKKLLTNNSAIKSYDFYLQSNIYVFQGAVTKRDIDAVKSAKMKPYDPKTMQKYNLGAWLDQVLKV